MQIYSRQYQDFKDNEFIYNANKSLALVWYVARQRNDLYDDDTDYIIAIFETATQKLVKEIFRSHHLRLDTKQEVGKAVSYAHFTENAKIVIGYQDGSTETVGYKYTCKVCHSEIPIERVVFLLETGRQADFCIIHSTEQAVVAFTSGDKGMTHVVIVKPENEEKLNTAKLVEKRTSSF